MPPDGQVTNRGYQAWLSASTRLASTNARSSLFGSLLSPPWMKIRRSRPPLAALARIFLACSTKQSVNPSAGGPSGWGSQSTPGVGCRISSGAQPSSKVKTTGA